MNSYTVRTAEYERDNKDLLRFFHSKDTLCNLNRKRLLKIEAFGTLAASRFVAFEADKPESLVAYASFTYKSQLPALPSDCWLEFLKKLYCIDHKLNISNSMFVHILIYHDKHEAVLRDILARAFLQEYWIQYCISIQMPTKNVNEMRYNENLEKCGRTYYPRDFGLESFSNTLTVNVIDKKDIVIKIDYRVALPGDNDDAMEILKVDRPDLYRIYGDYYIAEIVLKSYEYNEKVELVMGEIRDNVVGFIWMSENFNMYDFIKNYDVGCFGNLAICTPGRDKKYEDIKVNQIPEMYLQGTEKQVFKLESPSSCFSFTFKPTAVANMFDLANNSRFFELEHIFMKYQHMYEIPHNFYQEVIQCKIPIFYDLPVNPNNDQQLEKDWTLNDAKNAFLLRLFSVKPGFPRKQLLNFLCSAFSAFPDRDYCLLLGPKQGAITPTMQEILKYFLPIPKRPTNASVEDCFVLHRSTLFGQLWYILPITVEPSTFDILIDFISRLHELREEDVEAVFDFLGHNPYDGLDVTQLDKHNFDDKTKFNEFTRENHQRSVIEQVIQDVLNGGQYGFSFYVIRAGNASNPPENNALAGFVIVSEFLDHYTLFKHFRVPPNPYLRGYLRGEIHVLKLHQFFQIWSQEIFRQLAVKTDFHEFFYLDSSTVLSLDNDLFRNMMPIEPRRKKKYWFHAFDKVDTASRTRPYNLENINAAKDSVQVFYATIEPLRLLGNKRKIVIIGFSKYCKAFLRLMVFNWNSDNPKNRQHCCYAPDADITVIESSSIIEAEYDKNFKCKYCESKKNCYLFCQNDVAFVRDTTKRMDLRRYVRFINGPVAKIVKNTRTLFIGRESCRLQYDTLLLMSDRNFGLLKTHGNLCHFFPYNYIKINNRLDKIRLYYKTQALINSKLNNYRIIVYGFHIRMFECINFLITHGVPPLHLLLCLPPIERLPHDNQEPDRDLNTEYVLLCMAIEMGIIVQFHHRYLRWYRYDNENIIRSVVFEEDRRYKVVEYSCDMFIHFEQVHMDHREHRIFTKSGIAMRNHQILVNERYQTNDPCIYALGRYIQMRPNTNYQYVCVNEHEAASKLIQILGLSSAPKELTQLRYSQPFFFKAGLFNGNFFTKLIAPKRYVISFVMGTGKILQTYNNGDFTRVIISPNGAVKEITVLCRENLNLDFLEHFCGQQVTMLNHIVERYEMGAIKNLLDYFKMPWTELLMHELFEEQRLQIRSMIYPIVQSFQFMPSRNWEQFLASNIDSKASRIFHEKIVEFVRENRSDFVNEFALPEDFL